MSKSEQSKVYQADGGDPEMLRAYENARGAFRYFWREVVWDRHRIIPALGPAAVKAPFSDGDGAPRKRGTPEVEHMWFSDVDFDGRLVTGTLLNRPNRLKTVKQGDSVSVPLGEISDWMYSFGDGVYGGYTVNLLRSRMGKKERAEHDKLWGLNFGDPTKIRVAEGDDLQQHPLSERMTYSLKEGLAKDPSLALSKAHRGWTLLHQQASVGNAPAVQVLLEAGADRDATTDEGFTPLQLAQTLGWKPVAALLKRE